MGRTTVIGWSCVVVALGAAACAKELVAPNPQQDAGIAANGVGGADAGQFGNMQGHTVVHLRDAGPTGAASLIKDPPQMYCGPDPSQKPPAPTVVGHCPSDKNLEGCPCPTVGMSAPCWPGTRLQRSRGICKDGITTCLNSSEFGPSWGACEGYVLPDDKAVSGAAACTCFSAGKWSLSNLSPCIASGGPSGKTYMYSSLRTLNADGSLSCGTNISEPPPVPPEAWSNSLLNVDCAGQFKLCYTIKAGSVTNPLPSDCTIMQTCQDAWYAHTGKDQALPELPAWSSPNTDCAARFAAVGGYGEMSVDGTSIDCEKVQDPDGKALVFHRIGYCKPSCNDHPNSADCVDCRTGGSGSF